MTNLRELLSTTPTAENAISLFNQLRNEVIKLLNTLAESGALERQKTPKKPDDELTFYDRHPAGDVLVRHVDEKGDTWYSAARKAYADIGWVHDLLGPLISDMMDRGFTDSDIVDAISYVPTDGDETDGLGRRISLHNAPKVQT